MHVGLNSQGFRLLALQKLASLLWAGGEEVLDLVHPEHRRHDNPSCLPLRKRSNLAYGKYHKRTGCIGAVNRFWWLSCAGHDEGEDPIVQAQLEAIWRSECVPELCSLLAGEGGVQLAYDFGRLCEKGAPKSNSTIKFRQGDSDLKDGPAFPMAWAKTVIGLVAVSILSRNSFSPSQFLVADHCITVGCRRRHD